MSRSLFCLFPLGFLLASSGFPGLVSGSGFSDSNWAVEHGYKDKLNKFYNGMQDNLEPFGNNFLAMAPKDIKYMYSKEELLVNLSQLKPRLDAVAKKAALLAQKMLDTHRVEVS